jgi:hypothetical protein
VSDEVLRLIGLHLLRCLSLYEWSSKRNDNEAAAISVFMALLKESTGCPGAMMADLSPSPTAIDAMPQVSFSPPRVRASLPLSP